MGCPETPVNYVVKPDTAARTAQKPSSEGGDDSGFRAHLGHSTFPCRRVKPVGDRVHAAVPDSITTTEGVTFRPNLLGTTSFYGPETPFTAQSPIGLCSREAAGAPGFAQAER